jgi:hypothetical protein
MTHADLSPRPVDTGLEEAQTTRVERFLSFVLAVFVLIGLLWAYAVPLDRTDGYRDVFPTVPPAVVARDEAQRGLDEAKTRLSAAQANEVQARETYRTKLDAGQPAPTEAAAFSRAQADRQVAEKVAADAQRVLDQRKPVGDQAELDASRLYREDLDRRERDTLLMRLGLAFVALVLGFGVFEQLRRRRSRWVQPAMGGVAAAVVLTAVMTADYLDLASVGPIALSLTGTALTLGAIVAYQRWLAARLPERRARKAECPWCGYPARDGEHCEGCGRSVRGACTACHQPRRAGARYCGSCGAA